jgi:hypothetical protein
MSVPSLMSLSRQRSNASLEADNRSPPVTHPVLGSRPNSAVAAYFATDDDIDFSPVVTALVFLPDQKLLLTGDEHGYVTTWDVACLLTKAERHVARGEGDKWQSMTSAVPTVVATWRAHAVEVVSMCAAFGSDGANDGGRSVIASASDDRNVMLWTTDGVALGNLAQGRIANETRAEGIQPYIVDAPPDGAWALTAAVIARRAAGADPADFDRASRASSFAMAGRTPQDTAVPAGSLHLPLIGRRSVSFQHAAGEPSTRTARGGASPRDAGFVIDGVPRVDTACVLTDTQGSQQPSPQVPALGILHEPNPDASVDSFGTSMSVEMREMQAKYPPSFVGLIDPTKLSGQPQSARRPGMDRAFQHAGPRMPLSARPGGARQTRSSALRAAETTVSSSDLGTLPPLTPQGLPTHLPAAKKRDDFFSSATQHYLEQLGFNDNPRENAAQRSYRRHGRATIPQARGSGEASMRIL